jgi:hypothetical protein
MSILNQIFNLILGLVSTIIIISSILWGAFWLSDKMNVDDRQQKNS